MGEFFFARLSHFCSRLFPFGQVYESIAAVVVIGDSLSLPRMIASWGTSLPGGNAAVNVTRGNEAGHKVGAVLRRAVSLKTAISLPDPRERDRNLRRQSAVNFHTAGIFTFSSSRERKPKQRRRFPYRLW